MQYSCCDVDSKKSMFSHSDMIELMLRIAPVAPIKTYAIETAERLAGCYYKVVRSHKDLGNEERSAYECSGIMIRGIK